MPKVEKFTPSNQEVQAPPDVWNFSIGIQEGKEVLCYTPPSESTFQQFKKWYLFVTSEKNKIKNFIKSQNDELKKTSTSIITLGNLVYETDLLAKTLQKSFWFNNTEEFKQTNNTIERVKNNLNPREEELLKEIDASDYSKETRTAIEHTLELIKSSVNESEQAFPVKSDARLSQVFQGFLSKQPLEEKVAEKCKIDVETVRKIVKLSKKIQWCHGTTLATLVLAKMTDDELMPSGQLKLVPPFHGELSRGATPKGINQKSLSGTCMKGIRTAFNYAQDFNFKFDESIALETVQKFQEKYDINNITPITERLKNGDGLQDTESVSDLYRLTRWDEWNKFTIALRRMYLWNPEQIDKTYWLKWIETYRELIAVKSESFISGTTIRYCDKDKENVDYFRESLNQFETFLKNTPQKLTDYEKGIIQAGIPVVLASKNLTPRLVGDERGDHEYVIDGAVKIGSDVTYCLTSDKYVEQVKKFIESNPYPGGKLKVVSIDLLNHVMQAMQVK